MLFLAGLGFSACQKDAIAPTAGVTQTDTKVTASITTATNQDPIGNDTTKGYLRLQLALDTINYDNILIEFNPAASALYLNTEDAKTFAGMGAVSLSSLSEDNFLLAINQLPLVPSGTSVGLAIGAQASGVYKLNLITVSATIPSSVQIWLKDKCKNDSLDFRRYPSYAFNIDKSDTTTYGSHRFTLVVREQQ